MPCRPCPLHERRAMSRGSRIGNLCGCARWYSIEPGIGNIGVVASHPKVLLRHALQHTYLFLVDQCIIMQLHVKDPSGFFFLFFFFPFFRSASRWSRMMPPLITSMRIRRRSMQQTRVTIYSDFCPPTKISVKYLRTKTIPCHFCFLKILIEAEGE